MYRSKSISRVLPFILLASLTAGCDRHEHDDHEAEPESAQDHAEVDDHAAQFIELTPEAASQIGIETELVAVRALPSVLETTGQVDFDANRLTHVSPRLSGRAHSVAVQLGDDVERGQSLAVLDSIELGQAKAAFIRAQARHDLSDKNYERERGLLADRISSEREVLAAEALFLEAAADYSAAEQTLHLYGLSDGEVERLRNADPRASLYTVRAPLSGRVVEKHITLGELVTPERNVFTIADLSHVWIWIDVYERDVRHVHVDDEVAVVLDAYPGTTFLGTVSYLSDQVDARTLTVRARVVVPNPDGKLRPGSFATVRITDPHAEHGTTAGSEVIVVPQRAVQRDGDESVVFVVVGDGRFERREVELGRRATGLVEILVGLNAGERVVVEGTFVLKSEASKESMGGGHSH